MDLLARLRKCLSLEIVFPREVGLESDPPLKKPMMQPFPFANTEVASTVRHGTAALT